MDCAFMQAAESNKKNILLYAESWVEKFKLYYAWKHKFIV